ncbi:hypothetical protein Ancab_038965, partial [Ancistrocladus abbreviatus]
MKWLCFDWLDFDDNNILNHRESNEGPVIPSEAKIAPETETKTAPSLPIVLSKDEKETPHSSIPEDPSPKTIPE